MDSTVRRWLFILLVPLFPVICLYLLFDRQNYFQLNHTATGIFIVGPIGIYLVLVRLGLHIFLKLPESNAMSNSILKKLCGDWTFESVSLNNHVRTGDCRIEMSGGQLTLTGNFEEGGKTVGAWKHELAGISNNNLLLVYSLNQVGVTPLYGLVQIPLTRTDASQMTGTWNVVGREGMEGTITYKRKALVA